MGPAIEVKGLSTSFRSVRALDSVSLRVEPGEMVALIGASGSGKSTLIRMLSGLETADRANGGGLVRVLGETVQQGGSLDSEVRRVRARTGVIFQQFNLVGRMSLLTNVALGALGRVPTWRGSLGRFTRAERLAAMEALRRVGMERYASQRASTLSGGQQQRGAIARALMQRAEILLADEPIASLDPESARRVMDQMTHISRDDGITVMVSLHQVGFAVRYCPRAIALNAGRVIYDGPSEALTADFLRELYGAESDELILEEGLGRRPKKPEAMPDFGATPALARG